MFENISIVAGSKSIEIIRDEGLKLSRVKVLAGASGAAKFLVLTGIDRVLISLLKNRKERLDLIGSSIGSFRMAAFAQKNPLEALNILEREYIEQRYERKPTKEELTAKSLEIIDKYISDKSVDDILKNEIMSISFLVAKSKGFMNIENNLIQLSNLISAGALNYLNRKNLKYFFKRVIFSSKDNRFTFNDNFKVDNYRLNNTNFKQALLASGSIPLAMQGVKNIKGVKGTLRDGGMLDYHLDIPFLPKDSEDLVLYPHFYEYIIPGWFDKISKRRSNYQNMQNVVLVAPSKKFIDSLPYRKIPDRKDFNTFSTEERIKYWNRVIIQNKIIGDELFEAIESGKIKEIIKEF